MASDSAVWHPVGLVLAGCAFLALGLAPAPQRPAVGPQAVQASVPSPIDGPSCGAPVTLLGRSNRIDETLTAFTDALIFVPTCSRARTLEFKGSQVLGIGPALSVTRLVDGAGILAWYGFLGTEESVDFRLPGGEAALVSFTNDKATGVEDRNLIITWSFR